MNAEQARVFAHQAIDYEREQQDKQWGGSHHDDEHDDRLWVLLLMKHLGRLAGDLFAGEGNEHYSPDDVFARAVVIAALGQAYVESLYRRKGENAQTVASEEK